MFKAVKAPQTSVVTDDVTLKLTNLAVVHTPSASQITALAPASPGFPLATLSEFTLRKRTWKKLPNQFHFPPPTQILLLKVQAPSF